MVTVNILRRPEEDLFVPVQERFLSLLGERERVSIERTRKQKDKIEKTLGWAMCRMEAAQRFDVHPADVSIDFREKGKPFFPDYPNLGFNITHGGDVVIVAFSDGKEVGVDVESLDRKANLMIAERHFTSDETAFLKNIPEVERRHTFLRFWTAKEAYLKMTGTGITRPLSEFEIQFAENKINIFDNGIFQICTTIQEESYKKHIITVCVEGFENNFVFNRQNMQTIINFVEKF